MWPVILPPVTDELPTFFSFSTSVGSLVGLELASPEIWIDARRIQINGPFDFGTNGEYSFTGAAMSTTTNPTFESFLRGIPAFYIGTDPALSDSDRRSAAGCEGDGTDPAWSA
jgi:hypothetical protein